MEIELKKTESKMVLIEGDLYISSWDLSIGFEVEHRALTRRINKYKSEFEDWGVVTTRWRQPNTKKGGRSAEEYLLNEHQSVYLTTLLTNNEKVRKFKRWLTNEFIRQRRLLNKIENQRINAEWLEKRASGKIERRLETDTIKLFIEYAKNQGSQSAEKYYVSLTKMENVTLFALEFLECKFPNLRNILNINDLSKLQVADLAISRALKEGMEKGMHYKDIYKLAKERVELLAMAIGRTKIDYVGYDQLQIA